MQNNFLCKQCSSVISDTEMQIAEADVKPANDPLKDHLVSEIEIAIGEMQHYQESFNTAKKHLKELKKMVKHRVKAEMLAANI